MKTLLIVDDDKTFCEVLAESMRKRGYEVESAHSLPDALARAESFNPEWVLTDLKMPGASGLELIKRMLEIDPQTRIVMLTGYANIATAIEAIKLGALHYLSKPASTEEIIAAFSKTDGNPDIAIEEDAATWNHAEWEHIAKTLERHQHNISATARTLGMHRRTLQRKLLKMPDKFKPQQ